MAEPKPVDQETARQLFICGQIMGQEERLRLHHYTDKDALPAMLDQVDVELLEGYVKSPPEGFRYAGAVEHVIEMAKKRKESLAQRETSVSIPRSDSLGMETKQQQNETPQQRKEREERERREEEQRKKQQGGQNQPKSGK